MGREGVGLEGVTTMVPILASFSLKESAVEGLDVAVEGLVGDLRREESLGSACTRSIIALRSWYSPSGSTASSALHASATRERASRLAWLEVWA